MSINATRIIGYSEFGHPSKVLFCRKVPLPPLSQGQVLVQLLASPINPSDINQIQGTYPIRPDLSHVKYAVGGNEGVFQVVKSLSGSLQEGDWVLPATPGLGIWREYGVFDATHLLPIKNVEGLKPLDVAMVSVNPCTAYRMLSNDFVAMNRGDVIVQNGANSGVGQAVIQIAKLKGLKTVNIIRPREDFEQVATRLKGLGADIVLSEEHVRDPMSLKQIEALGNAPRLGLNMVGGKSGLNLVRLLGDNGHLVTYGGMSREPVLISTSAFIFKNVTAHGFWMSKWNQVHGKTEKLKMIQEILEWQRQGLFKNPSCIPLTLTESSLSEIDKLPKRAFVF